MVRWLVTCATEAGEFVHVRPLTSGFDPAEVSGIHTPSK